MVSSTETQTVVREALAASGFEERIFNVLVRLKVTFAEFAIHLSHDERERIFRQLDDIINVKDWHEEDELPNLILSAIFLDG